MMYKCLNSESGIFHSMLGDFTSTVVICTCFWDTIVIIYETVLIKFAMPTRIQPGDLSQGQMERTSFTKSFFRHIRLILFAGGMHTGESFLPPRKASRSKMKKLYILSVIAVFTLMTSSSLFNIAKKSLTKKDISRSLAFLSMFGFGLFLIFVYSFKFPKRLPEIEQCFFNYEKQYGLDNAVFYLPHKMKVVMLLLVSFALVVYPVQMVFLKNYPEIASDVFPNFYVPYPWDNIVITVTTISFMIIHIQWQGFLFVCVFLSQFFIREFSALSQRFKELSESTSNQIDLRFEQLVQQHDSLVDILILVSNCVQHFSFNILFLALPVNCSFLFAVLSGDTTQMEIIYICFGMSVALTNTAVLLCFEARVNSKIHEPQQYLWKLKKDTLSDRELQKLILFLTRLTGESIGFSIYGLLTVNMTSLLAIFGTITTYLIIVIQFHPVDTSLSLCDLLMKNLTRCASPSGA